MYYQSCYIMNVKHGPSVIKTLEKRIVAFRHLVSAEDLTYSIHQAHVRPTTNDQGQFNLSAMLTINGEASPPAHQCRAGSSHRPRFFGHHACTAPGEDHHRVIAILPPHLDHLPIEGGLYVVVVIA